MKFKSTNKHLQQNFIYLSSSYKFYLQIRYAYINVYLKVFVLAVIEKRGKHFNKNELNYEVEKFR